MGLAKLKIEARSTPEDYLTFERASDSRHEFLDGEIYQMAGESLPHSRICMNLAREVGNALKGKSCEPLSPNMKVRTFIFGDNGSHRLPFKEFPTSRARFIQIRLCGRLSAAN